MMMFIISGLELPSAASRRSSVVLLFSSLFIRLVGILLHIV